MAVNARTALDGPLQPAPVPGGDASLAALLVLREIESRGPMTGLDTLNRVAATAALLGIDHPGYPILHALTEAGHLAADSASPRLYRITASGSREAERLAMLCWPRMSREVELIRRRLALASPRYRVVSPASEWADQPPEPALIERR